VGSRSTNLTHTRNLNLPQPSTTPFSAARRPYTQFANIFYSDNGSSLSTQYHALQVDVERRFGRSFYFQAAWTFSKLMEGVADVGSEAGPLVENPYDLRRERAVAAFNPRHRINGAVIYELPAGRGHRFLSGGRIADALAGGWQVSTLFYYDAGRYSTPTFSGRDISATGTTGAQRPDRIADGNLPPGERTIDRWFDTAAFVVPAANSGRFGNSARNVIVGPTSKVVHASLAKRFSLSDRAKVQVQFNVLNLFNTENFDLAPSALNLSQPATAGRISSVRVGIEGWGPRTINLEARISF
jgi:hypothetical protein